MLLKKVRIDTSFVVAYSSLRTPTPTKSKIISSKESCKRSKTCSLLQRDLKTLIDRNKYKSKRHKYFILLDAIVDIFFATS